MPDLQTHQSAFQRSHFEDDTLDGARLVAPAGLDSAQRLSIYRNNTFITLTEALASTFPVVKELVGENFFDFTAKEFIKNTPPRQGPLFEYGEGLSRFLNDFEPASSLPYIGDIARLEWSINKAYHAENIPAINAVELSQIHESEFSSLEFDLHPACQVISSEYPVYDIWYLHQVSETSVEIDLNRGSNVIALRPDDEVYLHPLLPEYTSFLKALGQGKNIEQAYLTASQINEEFDPAQALVDLISVGAFSAVKNTNPALPSQAN